MGITEAQRAERKNHLGSSDIPAIMGFSRFSNKYDVWLEKTGRVQPKEKTQGYIQAGNLLEGPIIEWLGQFLGCGKINTTPEEMEIAVHGTDIVVHMDGQVVATSEPIEGKSEGVDHPIIGPWGEAGTDEVPEYTCIQAHCHIMACDTELCHVPTFLGGRGFGYFFVKRDNKLIQLIKEQAGQFMDYNVGKDIPPENVVPSLGMIKRIRRVEGEPRELDSKKVQEWIDAKDVAIAAVKAKEFHHAGILADLDGAEMGTCELGIGDEDIKTAFLITNLSQNRKSYVVEQTSFRVLRLKKKK